MGLQSVTFRCGHTDQVNLYGKHADRDRRAAWMSKNQDCPACVAAARDAVNAQAAAANASAGLPALTGTPKQIAWAESIRAALLKEIAGQSKAAKMMDLIARQTEARWWIDNRTEATGRNLMMTMLQGLMAAAGYLEADGRTYTSAGRAWLDA